MRNEDNAAGRCLKYKLSERVDMSFMRLSGHMKRISEEKLMKIIYGTEVYGTRQSSRPRTGGLDDVIEALKEKSMTIQQFGRSVQDKKMT